MKLKEWGYTRHTPRRAAKCAKGSAREERERETEGAQDSDLTSETMDESEDGLQNMAEYVLVVNLKSH